MPADLENSSGEPTDAVEAMRRFIAEQNGYDDPDMQGTAEDAVAVVAPLIAARVRAEAVADERQRIAAEVSAPAFTRSLWAVLRGSITAGDSIESIAECVVEEICSLAVAGSVPVATPEPIEDAATLLGRHAAYISRTATASYPDGMDSELVMRRRVGKIFVESGELGDAIEGWTGENPRKGVYATREDVIKELIDCALASLCAIEHLTGDAGLSVGMVAKQVIGNAHRLSESIPDRCDPVAGPVATPTEPAPGSDEAYRLQQRLQAENRLVATLHGRSDPCTCGDCAASPVPAEPARERLSGWFDVTEVPAVQPETPESDVRGTAHGSGIFGDLEASSAPDPVRRSPRFRNRPGQPRTPRMRGAAEQPEER